MAVTQKFIAEKVGISQKTVSLYFKGSDLIAPKTKEKIKQVTKKYGYLPNVAARSIKTRRFNRIACILAQDRSINTHPHLLAYINGAARELAKHGYSLVLEPFIVDIKTHTLIDQTNFFETLSVDGILGIAGTYIPDIVDEKINKMSAPVVWLNRMNAPDTIPAINFDEATGARELTLTLLDKGCRKFGWFGPEYVRDIAKHYSSQVRCETVKNILKTRSDCTLTTNFCRVREDLLPAARQIIAAGNLPEIFICYNFDYAQAMRYAAGEKGIKITAEMDIVHFASSWESSTSAEQYSTYVMLPEIKIAENGAKFLIDKIHGKDSPELLQPLPGTLHLSRYS